jgi:AbrB family looped-hinge helix DNA binding protein
MDAKVTLDQAGRVVLPKPLRDRMRLRPGETLSVESEGERIILRPIRHEPALKKEYGVWVYHGEAAEVPISDLIDRERDKRLRELMG